MRLSRLTTELRQYDWWIVIVSSVLLAIGLAAIYSIDLSRGTNLIFLPNQVLAIFIGSILFVLAARAHMSWYVSTAWIWYIAGLALLVGVLFFGVTIRGTTGWFRLAGFSFQPVEFAKVALVLVMALLIERQGRRFDNLQFVVRSGLITAFFVILVMFQPDLGSASVLVFLWLGILLITGTKKRYIAALLGIGLLVSIIAWFFLLAPYQKERVFTFIDPNLDPLGSGYNVNQSIIAIGSGGWRGRGLGFGSQSQLNFLPEAQSDFIFSVIAEELGFFGAATVLILYLLLIWRCIRVAREARSDFMAYTVLGVVLLLVVQIVFNIGATLGLLPVTGLPLPFLSYGGSSLIIHLLLLGIVESIARGTRQLENNEHLVEGLR